MKLWILIITIIPGFTFAESKLDSDLLSIGVVDNNYKIINFKAFDELFRLGTEQIAPMFPLRIDSVTTAKSMIMNRFGIYSLYQIDNIETKEEAKYLMENQNFAENYKSYMCSLDYSQSMTFKANGNMAANMSLVNSKNQVLYNLKVPFKECL